MRAKTAAILRHDGWWFTSSVTAYPEVAGLAEAVCGTGALGSSRGGGHVAEDEEGCNNNAHHVFDFEERTARTRGVL